MTKHFYIKLVDFVSNYVRVYVFLLVLTLILVIRLLLFQFPQNKEPNFSTTVVVNSPPMVEESYIVIKSSTYRVKVRDMHYLVNGKRPLQLGDKVFAEGSRYYSTIYADKVSYAGEVIYKPLLVLKSKYLRASLIILSEPYSSLLNGMLFGTDPVISPTFKEKLIQTGVIHIIVVSGYNITILFVFVYRLFYGLSAKPKVFIGSLVVIFYVCAVGFEPPVLRALIMGLLVGFSKAFGAVRSTIYVLVLSSILLLIVNPQYIASVSFQLTFAASLGLILLGSPFYNLLDRRVSWFSKLPYVVKESISSSTVAQIYVLPIISYYFGRVSLLGFVVNPLVLWVIPLVMLLGFVFTTMVVLGLYPLVAMFSYILSAPLIFFVDVVQIMSQLPGGNIPLSINVITMIAYYTVTAVLSIIIVKQNSYLLNEN